MVAHIHLASLSHAAVQWECVTHHRGEEQPL